MSRSGRLTPYELEDEAQYELVLEIDHDHIVPFVLEWLRRPTPVLRAYQAVLAVLAAFTIWMVMAATRGSAVMSLGAVLKQLGVALLANVTLLVPTHEFIHAAVYKILGAPSIHLGADWKRFVFYAVADHFVVDRCEFTVLALAPLVLISVAFVGVAVLVPSWAPFSLAAVTVHTLHCAGDAALLGYMFSVRTPGLYTYDDVHRHRSYFYARR